MFEFEDIYKKGKCEHKDCNYEEVEYKPTRNYMDNIIWFGICPKCKRQTCRRHL